MASKKTDFSYSYNVYHACRMSNTRVTYKQEIVVVFVPFAFLPNLFSFQQEVIDTCMSTFAHAIIHAKVYFSY